MRTSLMDHTISIFEKLSRALPLVAPESVKIDIKKRLKHAQSDIYVSIDELEDALIDAGKKAWPHIQAFEELYAEYADRLGHKLLLQRLPRHLKNPFAAWIAAENASFHDVFCGRGVHICTDEADRRELSRILVELKEELRKYVCQAVLTTDKDRYEQKVAENQCIIIDIQKQLDELRAFADREMEEHPDLAEEIHAHVRAIEEGLCMLGPCVHHSAVLRACEYFMGRKKEKKMRVN